MDKDNPNGHRQAEGSSLNKRNAHCVRKTPSARPDPASRGDNASRSNANNARAIWGAIPKIALNSLAELTEAHGLSVAAGDLQFLDGRWYVTHAGLLGIAQRRRCSGIRTALQRDLSDPVSNRWIFKATVYKISGPKGFVGYGDADPTNTSPLVRGAEMSLEHDVADNLITLCVCCHGKCHGGRR